MKQLLFTACTMITLLLAIPGGNPSGAVPAPVSRYAVIAWNDLGMHCMDHDYSVFAILPPYNNLHAQVVDRFTGKLVSSGVALTYESVSDTRGSINTTSSGKTNFWDWVLSLFGAALPVDIGLAGNHTESLTPAPLAYDAVKGYWKAEGIPQVPYDDKSRANYYPMVKVVAKDLQGNVLAETRTVLPVSDEMTCVHCHASGVGDPAAQPVSGWVNDPDPEKDWKKNILKRHDDRNSGKQVYTASLALKGYDPAGLLATAAAGRPVLCAGCHASNALGTPVVLGIKPLTASIHSWHATNAMDDATGMPLDNTTNRSACYYCHPGSVTQCLRGVMGAARDGNGNLLLQCQSCHGSMSTVGSSGRQGWVDLPKCQYCHYAAGSGYVRDTSVFDASGNYRAVVSIFASTPDLYKTAAGHGKVQCEGCHGSTHAEYPSSEANDNVQSISLQGYAGQITECRVCHFIVPITKDGGPHGLHTIGQKWVYTHRAFARQGSASCATCHGSDYRGTVLSRASAPRSFTISAGRIVTYAKGQKVGCFDCHAFPR